MQLCAVIGVVHGWLTRRVGISGCSFLLLGREVNSMQAGLF
jgi:hypothetical protein